MICNKAKECAHACKHSKEHSFRSQCIPPCPDRTGGIKGAKCTSPIMEADEILNEEEEG